MNLVLPIVFFAVVFGLFVPQDRIQRYRWLLVVWIVIIVAVYWIKNP
jgi:hypothetical protein